MFNKAVRVILEHEGGYVNHPNDPGGETNYGISKRAYPYLDIKNLTREEAKAIYKKDYWYAIKGNYLPEGLDLMIFDMAVNAGISRSVKLLQNVLGVTSDGILGPKTMEAIIDKDVNDLIYSYAIERIDYYSKLPTFKTFGKGWIKRVISTLKESLRKEG